MRYIKWVVFWFCILCSFLIQAQEAMKLDVASWESGKAYFDENQWTEVIAGNIPLVITVPHGGRKKPAGMTDRTCKDNRGRIVRVTDKNTQEVARFVGEAFMQMYGWRPYIIINHVARGKVDQNRRLEYGACEDEKAILAWNNFHQATDSILAHTVEHFGYAFYIDLHGHGHSNQRLELGYGLTKKDLQKMYEGQDLEGYARKSSMANFIDLNPEINIRELFFGQLAFGTSLNKEGLAATPSQEDSHPVGEEPFFSGGYNIRRYTSSEYPSVFGVQIEINYVQTRDSLENARAFAFALANAYTHFVQNHQLQILTL